VRELEGQRDSESSDKTLSSGPSQSHLASPSNAEPQQPQPPDWTTLKELGTYVRDDDGYTLYMGASSGVAFTAKVMHDVYGNEQPPDNSFFRIFAIDDTTSGKWLAESDQLLWQVRNTIGKIPLIVLTKPLNQCI
jgi:hypothetical protein